MFNIKKLIVLLLCAGLVFQAHFGIAGPQGGKVVGGNANISQTGPNTTINQSSDRAIINWNSFDIGKNESVRHNMPSSNSAGLHRVVGKGGPSQIEGLLQSNGNIYLVNPAGVVIHNGAKIDVNGFVATTRDIANENFMKGKMVFDKPGMPGAAIINQGNISLKDNGLAVLVAPTVRNDGIIAGKLGKVALGGSDAAWKLDMTGDDLIAFTMDEKQVNTLYAADGTPLASVQNNGKIKAEGGVVVLTASQLDGIVGSVVNNGEISAASAETKGGKIIFRGQGNKVDVVNNGNLDVSSKAAEGGNVRMTGQATVIHAGKIDATGKTKGGNVVITGENVTLKSGSRIDASGTNGGGTVLVGGNARGKGPETNAKTTLVQSDAEILADAKLFGDGGQIVVWADEKTQFDGKATARGGENGGNGGLVETSAKLLIIGDPAVVNTSAKKGKAGEWLLDPEDFVIAASDGSMTGQQVSDSLENNNIILEIDDTENEYGKIIVNDKIEWNSNNILTLDAHGGVIINANITINGGYSGLIINTLDETSFTIADSYIRFNGNSNTLNINSNPYILIKSFDELLKINNNLDGNYALAQDIDGQNHNILPIGVYLADNSGQYSRGSFKGMLNGMGNNINNIQIIYDGENHYSGVGLISRNNGLISNINLKNIIINKVTSKAIGLLCGNNYGTISSSSVDGIINAEGIHYMDIGGLAGANNGNIYCSSSKTKINFSNIAYECRIGGFVGNNDFYGGISECASNVDIVVKQLPGGYFGRYDYNYVGGFVGLNDPVASITNSYAIGSISYVGNDAPTSNYINGGFVGRNQGVIRDSHCSINIESNVKDVLYNGGFVGEFQDLSNAQTLFHSEMSNCYYNRDVSSVDKGIGFYYNNNELQDGIEVIGLNSDEMRQQSSFKDWDFKYIWKMNEERGYPELRRVANNYVVSPDKPVDPNPPIVDPDSDPKPDVPDTPDNPDVPVNPDPKPDTPVTPDKPVNPDPKPDTPVTPEQPSNPGTNPGGTPSQPSTKPDTKPETPGTNQPGKPDTPVVPEQPSKPVQPEKPVTPEQPSNPGTTPGGNTPSQPDTKPETPVTPNRPSNPGNNSGSNNSNTGNTQFPTGTTITYKVIDGNVHVFQDNQHIGIMEGNRIKLDNNDIPVEIEDGKTYVKGGDLEAKEYNPYTATPEERQAYAEKIQRELEEQKASHNQAMTEIFNDSYRKNIATIVDKAEKSISEEMNLLSDVIVDLYACELAIMGSIFSGEKISGVAGGLSNFGAAVHSNLKTILGTLTRNGWGDQLRAKPYMQALTTKDFMALYMLTIAENAQKRFNQADNVAAKLQLLCQMELATKLADSIANDYSDTIRYFVIDAGEEAAKGLINELVGKTINKNNFSKYYETKSESISNIAQRTSTPSEFVTNLHKQQDTIDAKSALATQLTKGAINEGGKEVTSIIKTQYQPDDTIQGMVNRLMHSQEVDTIINNTMEKYNGIVKTAGLEGSFQDGKISFNQDIRDCWNWDPGIAESLNKVMTSDLPGAKLGDAIGNVLGPAIGPIFGFKPKQEQLSNLYTKSDNSQNFSNGEGAGGGSTSAGSQ